MPRLMMEGQPLHMASAEGHLEAVKLLLKKKADITSKDKEGYQALHAAASYNHGHVIQELLQRGVQVDAKVNDGRTALHLASGMGHSKAAQLLLNKKADIASKDKWGFQPLHYATMRLSTRHQFKIPGTQQTLSRQNTPNPSIKDLMLFHLLLKNGSNIEQKLARLVSDLLQAGISQELILKLMRSVRDSSKGEGGSGSAKEKEALDRASNNPECVCQSHCFFALMYTPQNLLSAGLPFKNDFEKLCQKCRLFAIMQEDECKSIARVLDML